MNSSVVLTEALLRSALRHLAESPEGLVYGSAGFNVTPEDREWLVRRVHSSPGSPSRRGPGDGEAVDETTVIFTAQPAIRPVALPHPLAIVHLPHLGVPSAGVFHPDGRVDPARVRVLGPGLSDFPPPFRGESGASTGEASGTRTWETRFLPSRFSRTAGAMGEAVWRRFASLRYGVVGCGRTGSLLATSLVRMGAREVVLVDADRLEPPNLDGDGVLPADLARPKVEVLAEHLRAVHPEAHVETCAASVTSLEALSALKRVDVLLHATDNDGALQACGLLAALYLKPLLVVGTGVLRPEEDAGAPVPASARRWGADLRWILPDRCLGCTGGIAHPEHLRALLHSRAEEGRFQAERDWRHERAGSLRCLNQAAAGLALQLLVGFLTGHPSESVWLRLEADPLGLPEMKRLPLPRDPNCALCARAGEGDGPPSPA